MHINNLVCLGVKRSDFGFYGEFARCDFVSLKIVGLFYFRLHCSAWSLVDCVSGVVIEISATNCYSPHLIVFTRL